MGLSNPLHIAFIAAIALIVLGPKRMPELARTIGNGLRELREAIGGESGNRESSEAIAPGPTVFAPPTGAVSAEDGAPFASASPVATAAPLPAEQEIGGFGAAPTPAEQRIAAPTPAEQELGEAGEAGERPRG
jgi:hypothetical protein